MFSQRRSALTPFGLGAGILSTLALIVFAAACGSGEKTLLQVDPQAVPDEPTYEMVVAILDRSCVPCHQNGDDGEPEEEDDDPNFDACEGILAGLPGLITEALVKEAMPPGAWPRLNEREKLTIQRWAQNGACAPCNPCP
jgi:uncharacterized membrane protein